MEASKNPLQPEAATISKLPPEILNIIAKHLNGFDLLSFAASCKRFSTYCPKITQLNFENDITSLSGGKSAVPALHNYLTSRMNPSLLKACNFNGWYWVKPAILERFLIKCHNLQKLEVAETKLTINQIVAHILPHCPSVTSLSFTMRKHNWSCVDPNLLHALTKLISVEIIMEDGCIMFKLLNFLQKCVNLEVLVVSRASACQIPWNIYTNGAAIPMIGPFPKLKRFIFVGFPMGATPNGHQLLFDSGSTSEKSQMDTFWSNVIDVPHSLESSKVVNLSWDEIGNLQQEPEQVHSKTMQSVWEPFSICMQSPKSSPDLKLANCVYDGSTFHDFCLNHRSIEVLKLRMDLDRAAVPDWSDETWKMVSKITAISLDVSLIAQREEGLDAGEKWIEIIDPSYIPYMRSIVMNCPMIQEIELIGSGQDDCIKQAELSAIAQCSNLKNLTISDFRVAHGQFFEPILKNCVCLESLRLKNVGPSKLCVYSASLATCLPLAKKLQTFCIFQDFMKTSDITKLLDNLEKCPLISRVSLVCPSVAWNLRGDAFSGRFVQFCDKLKRLVALFGVVKVPNDTCKEVSNTLTWKFKRERPAFLADIQSAHSVQNSSPFFPSDILPLVHSDILTRVESRVGIFPLDHKPILHRLN